MWDSIDEILNTSLDMSKGLGFVVYELRPDELTGVPPFRAVLREDAAPEQGAERLGPASQAIVYAPETR